MIVQINRYFLKQTLLLALTIFIYILIPRKMEMSMPLFYFTFILSIISGTLYFKFKRKCNYFDFDTIFIIVNYLIYFFSPFFFNEPYYKYLFLGFEFDTRYINSASVLASIGMQSYFCGSLYKKTIQSKQNVSIKTKIYSTKFLSLILLLLIFLFILVGGLDAYRFVYSGEGQGGSGIHTYFLLLIIVFSIVIETIEIYNKCKSTYYRFNYFSLFIILCFSLALLSVGNRTGFSQLILPFMGLYFAYFYNLKIKQMFYLFVLGVFAMWIVQNTRAKQDVDFSNLNYAMILTDMTIPSRQTYVAMEYVDDKSITYGKSMSFGVIGVIPKLASCFKESMEELGSAELLTAYTFDNLNRDYTQYTGLGTTMVADTYLAFGGLGVVILMFTLGNFVNVQNARASALNMYSMLTIAVLLSNSIFLARASYTHFLKYAIWTIVLFYLLSKLYEKNRILYFKS